MGVYYMPYMSDNSQDGTIGNQQERLFFNIGYLIGIIDGEGCYQFGKKYEYKGYSIYAPRITIFNNNIHIIEQTIRILKELDITHNLWKTKMHGKDKSQGYRIEIAEVKRVKKFTDLILKYPSGKHERAKLLNDYCNFRLSIPWGKRKSYVAEEKVFFDKLREMNLQFRKGTKSSETIRFDATA
jgi:hypothetical protein